MSTWATILRHYCLALFTISCVAAAGPSGAEEATPAAAQYIGAKECQSCHKAFHRTYLASRHGKVFTLNPQTERQTQGCEACHGPGSSHAKVAGELDYKGPLMIRKLKGEPPEATNAVCLGCHESGQRMHWRTSRHAAEGLACTSCHTLHSEGPTVTQEICATCHTRERAKLQRTAHMPLREGKMACMDCHNPHGGIGPNSLKAASTNEVCYECHAEKRGPNIFEHPPVRENCANCHDPHGTNHVKLLKKKPPHLCNQCHSIQYHPSDLREGSQVAAGSLAKQVTGKGCVNCHSQIHGSNHPSGARFQR